MNAVITRRLALLALVAMAPLALLGAAPKPQPGTIAGVYRANGKDAKLTHMLLVHADDFSGQKTVTLVMTEKDASKDDQPDVGAMFGKYGSALIVGVQPDGGVISCQIAHTALEHPGVSSVGRLKTKNFKWANGQVSGKLTTEGKATVFDETWEADLDFSGKLP